MAEWPNLVPIFKRWLVSHTPWALTFAISGVFGGRRAKYYLKPPGQKMLQELIENSLINPVEIAPRTAETIVRSNSEKSNTGPSKQFLRLLEIDPELYPFAWLATPMRN